MDYWKEGVGVLVRVASVGLAEKFTFKWRLERGKLWRFLAEPPMHSEYKSKKSEVSKCQVCLEMAILNCL